MVRRYGHFWLCLTHYFKVPVIVLFTKYDQFLRNVRMHMVDYPGEYQDNNVLSEVVEKQFQDYYLSPLGPDVRFVRLESRFGVNQIPGRLVDILGQKCTKKMHAAMSSLRGRLKPWMIIWPH